MALITGVPLDIIGAVHASGVGVGSIVLRGRPPVAVVADIVEAAVGIAVAARQSRSTSGSLR